MLPAAEPVIPLTDEQLFFGLPGTLENDIGMGRRYDIVVGAVNDENAADRIGFTAEVKLKGFFEKPGLDRGRMVFGRRKNGPAVHGCRQRDHALGIQRRGGGKAGCATKTAPEETEAGAHVKMAADKGHRINKVSPPAVQRGDRFEAPFAAAASPMVEPKIGQSHLAAAAGQLLLLGGVPIAVKAVGPDDQMWIGIVGQVQGAPETQAVRFEGVLRFLAPVFQLWTGRGFHKTIPNSCQEKIDLLVGFV